MDLLLAAARPWHYWISIVLVGAGVLGVLLTAVGYYIRVVSQRGPRA